MWLSPVECLVRDQEAAGSNPVTPMTVAIPKKSCDIFRKAFFCFCFDKAAFLQALSKYPVTKDKVFGIELKNRIFAGFKDIKNNFCDIY